MTVYHYVTENWLNALVVIHVLAAIIGIGPTFFSPLLLRNGQTLGQARYSLALMSKLEFFPKILGSLAVVSGLLLAWLGDNYGFDLFWIYGSIAIYVIIQVIVIGFLAPLGVKAAAIANDSKEDPERPAPADLNALIVKANKVHYVATAFGVLLFLFMFFKPTLS